MEKSYPELDEQIKAFKVKYGEHTPIRTVEDAVDTWMSNAKATCLTVVGKEEGVVFTEEASPSDTQRAFAAYRKCLIEATEGALEYVKEKTKDWSKGTSELAKYLENEPIEDKLKRKRGALGMMLTIHNRGREGSKAHTKRTYKIKKDIFDLEELEGGKYIP